MKKLLILNGLMGSGKSTFIKENKLEDFTLSSDELRIKMAGFDMSENGLVISQKKDRQVWAVLYTMLETRMEMGLFTVVDAMHLRTRDFKKYKELAVLYGYEIYAKRFDNVTLEELLERNKNRESYKQIPENVIAKKYETFVNQVLPEYVTAISDINELYPQPENLDNYNNIKCIGDIHNNADKLELVVEEIKNNQNSLYIFTGDIFDRGPISVKQQLYDVINRSYKYFLTKYGSGLYVCDVSFSGKMLDIEHNEDVKYLLVQLVEGECYSIADIITDKQEKIEKGN